MIGVPRPLTENLPHYYGERGRQWLADLPRMLDAYLDRWQLAVDGAPMHGIVGLVVPVRRADGVAAALKVQITDPEHPGEAAALQTWNGDGAVCLLAEDETGLTSAMLLDACTPRIC